MYLRGFILPLWLVAVAKTLKAESPADVVDSSEIRKPELENSQSNFEQLPLPYPIVSPGFGLQAGDEQAKNVQNPSATLIKCGPGVGSCPDGFCCNPLGM